LKKTQRLVGENQYLQFGENIEEHQKLFKSDETMVVFLYDYVFIHYGIKIAFFNLIIKNP